MDTPAPSVLTCVESEGSRCGLVPIPPSNQLDSKSIRFNRSFQDLVVQSTPLDFGIFGGENTESLGGKLQVFLFLPETTGI